MQIAWVLIRTKLTILAALLLDRRKSYLARNIVMIMVLWGMVAASYLFFYHLIFGYLIVIEDIGIILIDRLVSVGFLIFFVLLVISSMVISIGSLYRSRETEYLFSTPLPVTVMFTGKYIDIVVFSSWTILVMAVPILTAYARIREFGALDYAIAGVVILLPYVLIASSIGSILAILFKFISKHIHPLIVAVLGTMVVAGLITLVVIIAKPSELQIQFTEDFRALNLFINNVNLNANPFTPNYWLIESLRGLADRSYRTFFLYSGALASSAWVAISLLYLVVGRFYFNTWLASIEQRSAHRRAVSSAAVVKTGWFSRPAQSQERALLKKDILVFMRDPAQWSQLMILLVLLGLYFINLRLIPGDIDLEHWRTILFIMNLVICGLVLSTLAVRFVFPSLSLEGDSFWVLGAAPLTTLTLIKEKFFTSFIAFFIIAETIGGISVWLLALEELYRLLTFGIIFLMSITLSSLAVGFGAAFPDFTERNPSKIASSPGGILTITVSLGYIAVMTAITTIPASKYTAHLVHGYPFPHTELIAAIVLTVLVNAALIAIPLRMGVHAFTRREY